MSSKKVILVGSAGYLNKARLGSYIDEFDVIWRTNFTGHPHTIKSYPEIVGSKYGNWFLHAIQWGGFKFLNNKIFSFEKALKLLLFEVTAPPYKPEIFFIILKL